MSTITPSPARPLVLIHAGPGRLRRASSMFMVFWHMLRRDLLVAGRDIVSIIAQMVLQPLFILFILARSWSVLARPSKRFRASSIRELWRSRWL